MSDLQLIYVFFAINSVIIVAVVFALFMLGKKISRFDISKAIKKLEETENLVNDFKVEIENFNKRLVEIEEKSVRNNEVFKRVVYGFDFIVQGCKKALDIGNIETVEEQMDTTYHNLLDTNEEETSKPVFKDADEIIEEASDEIPLHEEDADVQESLEATEETEEDVSAPESEEEKKIVNAGDEAEKSEDELDSEIEEPEKTEETQESEEPMELEEVEKVEESEQVEEVEKVEEEKREK